MIAGPSVFFRGEAFELALAAIPASADVRRIEGAEKTELSARVSIDDGQVYAPAVTRFPAQGRAIGTPSVTESPGWEMTR